MSEVQGKLRVTRISPNIGAIVEADAATLLSGSEAKKIRELLEDRGVLVFPKIGFDEEQQIAFTRTLGEMALEYNGVPGNGGELRPVFKVSLDESINPMAASGLKTSFFWHLDGSMHETPILASLLMPRILSKTGGDTEFCNTYAAYEGLSDEDKAMLVGKIFTAQPPAGSMEDAPPPGREAEWAARPIDMDSPQIKQMILTQQYFYKAIAERQNQPVRNEVMSEFAHTTRADGSRPDTAEIVQLALFLFAAGQDTSAKLIGNAMRYLVDVPGLQQQLRADTSLIAAFVEEVLRLEGSLKASKRLALRPMIIGGVPIAPGTQVVIALTAASRDPRRWENPHEFILNRPRIKEHLAFARGAHTCIGAALTRYETRIFFEKLIEHTSDIRISEKDHGPTGNRTLEYEASHSLRGLSSLQIEVDPA